MISILHKFNELFSNKYFDGTYDMQNLSTSFIFCNLLFFTSYIKSTYLEFNSTSVFLTVVHHPIHLINQYSLSTCCVPCSVLGAGLIVVHMTDRSLSTLWSILIKTYQCTLGYFCFSIPTNTTVNNLKCIFIFHCTHTFLGQFPRR